MPKPETNLSSANPSEIEDSNLNSPDPSISGSPAKRSGAIDLLALVDVERDAVRGTWKIENGSLFRTNPAANGDLVLPYTIQDPLNYSFRATVTAGELKSSFGVVLPIGGNYVTMAFGGWKTLSSDPVSGLSAIKGKTAPQNETANVGHSLTPGKRHTCEIRVSGENSEVTIEVDFDGEDLVRWSGNPADLSLRVDVRKVATEGEPRIYLFDTSKVNLIHELHLYPGSAGYSEEDWTDLFNGVDLTGWKSIGEHDWTVRDGSIFQDRAAKAKVPMPICRELAMSEFEMEGEFLASPEIDSGVFIVKGMTPGEVGWLADDMRFSREMSIVGSQSGLRMAKHRTGNMIGPSASQLNHIDDGNRAIIEDNTWNEFRILVGTSKISTWINGEKTSELSNTSFTGGKVYIAIGATGRQGNIAFRDLRIRPIHVASAPASDTPDKKIPEPVKALELNESSLFDHVTANGGWQDVLGVIGREPSFSTGTWTMSGDSVIGEAIREAGLSQAGNAVRGIRVTPLQRFDARMRFSADPETSAISVFMPSPDGGMSIYAWFKNDKLGIQYDVDPTKIRPRLINRPLSSGLDDGEIHEMEVNVDGSHLTVSIDGEVLLKEPSVDWSQWNQALGYGANLPPILGVRVDGGRGGGKGKVEFHSFEIRIPEGAPEEEGKSTAPEPDEPALSIPEIPDLQSRLDSYRDYRKEQIGALVVAHRVELTARQEAAIQSGDLNAVEEVSPVLQSLDTYTSELSTFFSKSKISPLPLPPAIPDLPESLTGLVSGFREQLEKSETDTTEKLDQSLELCERALTRSDKIEDAFVVREFRSSLIQSMTNRAVVAAPNALESEDWIDLFNGRDLDGWAVKMGSSKFAVENGEIVGRIVPGSPSTFLCTTETFDDFELIFEVKKSGDTNSGVQIRSLIRDGAKQPSDGVVHGPQVDIGRPGLTGFLFGESANLGWINGEPTPHNHFKNGEWNQFRVLAKGPRIQTWINGEPVEDCSRADVYSEYPRGFIGLQLHRQANVSESSEVRFRKIRLRR